MAERSGLLNRRTLTRVPRVRIPVSPQESVREDSIKLRNRIPVVSLLSSKIEIHSLSGCSVARLSRRVWDAEVAGSNPATPTNRFSAEHKPC